MFFFHFINPLLKIHKKNQANEKLFIVIVFFLFKHLCDHIFIIFINLINNTLYIINIQYIFRILLNF